MAKALMPPLTRKSLLGRRRGRLGLSALQILLPATLALFGLWLGGFLALSPALLAWLGAALISTLLAVLRERRLQATRQYMIDLAEAREPRPPPSFGPLIDDGLDGAFRHLSHALTERRERMLETDRLLSALLEALPDPLLLVGEGREVLRANRAADALFGHPAALRPLEASLRDPAVLAATDDALARKGEAHLSIQLPGPSVRAFAIQVVPVELQGEAAVLIGLRELTEQVMIERMRSDFIANASHEIRTPLAALLGFIETLQGPAREDPQAQQQFLRTMEAEARRMSRLVDDLLSLSRIELIAHQPPQNTIDLAECARTVVRNLEPYALRRHVELQLELPPELPRIRADRDQIIQLLTNLIDNAIKYGGEGKPVEITGERLDAAPPGAGPLTGRPTVRMAIRDHGRGIAREHLPRVTERFFRVDPARSRQLGGTGLGLAIVKHILRRHHGHLLIESGLGEGSRFIVYLPLIEEVPKSSPPTAPEMTGPSDATTRD
jgi:two-component system, OmpR family, phosphate regulon sensor histidine kinase PhoR